MIQLLLWIVVFGVTQDADPKEIGELIALLASDDIAIRDKAEWRLKELGSRAVPQLENAARGNDVEISFRAKKLIKVIAISQQLTARLKQTLPGVEERLALGNAGTWTEVLLEALEQRGGRYRYPFLLREDLEFLAVPAIRGASTEKLRMEVCYAVSGKRLVAASPEILKLLREHPDVNFRITCCFALRSLAATEAIPDLLEHLANRDDQQCMVREAASQALVQLDVREAIPQLVRGLKDESQVVRIMACRDLGELEASEAVPDLTKLLRSASAFDRAHSARALGQIGATEAVAQIVPLLDDRDADVRWRAMGALASLGATASVPKMILLLRDNSPLLCRQAAWALGDLGALEAKPELVRLLGHERSTVRAAGAVALGRLGARETVQAHIRLLEDPDPMARMDSIKALVALEAADAIPALTKALADVDPAVKFSAASGLCVLGSYEGVSCLLEGGSLHPAVHLPAQGVVAGFVAARESLQTLNAVRRPEAWKRLSAKRMKESRRGTAQVLAEGIAAETGMPLLEVRAHLHLKVEASILG